MLEGKPRLRKYLARAAGLVGCIIALALLIVGALWWQFDSKLTRIEPSAESAYRWPYYLYVPTTIQARVAAGSPVHLLVLPNNTGRADDDFAVHERAAWLRAWRDSSLADELDVVALVPIFPRPASSWQVYTHALDRDCLTTKTPGLERIDLQLLAMIDDARAALATRGWSVDERVLLMGFSANGMFADRFTALHPDRVLVAAIGSPGGWPIAPISDEGGESLRYPVGIADLEELTGRAFDRDAYAKVPMFIFMGERDTNDSLQFGDGYDEQDKQLVERHFGATPPERWEDSVTLHKSVGTRAHFMLYPGTGHKFTGEMTRARAAILDWSARRIARPSLHERPMSFGSPLWTARLPFSLFGSMTPVCDLESDSVYVSDGWGTAYASICLRKIGLRDGAQQLELRTRTDLASACLDERGDSVLAVGRKRLIEFDRRTGSERERWQKSVPQNSFHSALIGRKTFLMHGDGPTLGIYDLTRGSCERKRIGSCDGLFVDAAENLIIASGKEGLVSEYAPATGRVKQLATPGPFRAAAYSRADQRILLGLGEPFVAEAGTKHPGESALRWDALALLSLGSGARVDVPLGRTFQDLWVSRSGETLYLAQDDRLRRCQVSKNGLVTVDERHLQPNGRILLVVPERSIALCVDRGTESVELNAYTV
ncbi:MAG TPA: hypothetical protein VK843_13460 [Planctomycetota bacterium]|nr:hypothetical protein [Planctomycetota bacterium]